MEQGHVFTSVASALENAIREVPRKPGGTGIE